MRASVYAASGILVALLGVAIALSGLGAFAASQPVAGVVLVVIGVLLYRDGNGQYRYTYPRARFHERVAMLGNPVGMTVSEVRDVLGVERGYENRDDGCELTWSVGKLSLSLSFDARQVCTGIASAYGVRPHR